MCPSTNIWGGIALFPRILIQEVTEPSVTRVLFIPAILLETVSCSGASPRTLRCGESMPQTDPSRHRAYNRATDEFFVARTDELVLFP